MRILDGAQPTGGPLALAIGNFDGVHRGHQELVRVARERAARLGGTAGVLTFTPHPARVFAPAVAPPLIVSLEHEHYKKLIVQVADPLMSAEMLRAVTARC